MSALRLTPNEMQAVLTKGLARYSAPSVGIEIDLDHQEIIDVAYLAEEDVFSIRIARIQETPDAE